MKRIEPPPSRDRVNAALERPIARSGTRALRVRDLTDLFLDAGMRVLIVGGAPRDWLAGAPGNDIDLYLDRPIEHAMPLLCGACGGIGGTLLHNERYGTLRWGDADTGWVDINILRSWKDIRNDDMWTTTFVPRTDLIEDAQMRDFSVNAFYYDLREESLLDPLECGLDDLRAKRLRLITHRRVLDTSCRTTFRIAQFLCRGYSPTDSVLEHLERCADRDIQGMGARLQRWIPNHFSADSSELTAFGRLLYAHARQPASIEILDAHFR
jgi:tRNA nucleotidyltransferase/poly(A) polymerase